MRGATGWKRSEKKYKEHFHWDDEASESNNLTEEILEPFMVHPRRRILAHLKQVGVQPNERIPYNSAPPPTINQQYIISSAPPDPGEFNANEYPEFVFPIHHLDDGERTLGFCGILPGMRMSKPRMRHSFMSGGLALGITLSLVG